MLRSVFRVSTIGGLIGGAFTAKTSSVACDRKKHGPNAVIVLNEETQADIAEHLEKIGLKGYKPSKYVCLSRDMDGKVSKYFENTYGRRAAFRLQGTVQSVNSGDVLVSVLLGTILI